MVSIALCRLILAGAHHLCGRKLVVLHYARHHAAEGPVRRFPTHLLGDVPAALVVQPAVWLRGIVVVHHQLALHGGTDAAQLPKLVTVPRVHGQDLGAPVHRRSELSSSTC